MGAYDVIIVGGGPAGLSAAIYTCRKGLKTAIISVDVGGQTMLALNLENYPGYTGSGYALSSVMREQAEGFGVEILFGKVTHIDKVSDGFSVRLEDGEHHAKSIILAYGKIPKTPGILGEDKYIGRGMHVCATCDAPMYKGKSVAVIGGGNSALDATMLLSGIARQVCLIHRREEMRGDVILFERLRSMPNVILRLGYVLTELKGEPFLNSVVLRKADNGAAEELAIDGLFLEIGYEVNSEFVRHLVQLNERKEIIVDERCHTSCPGIFAAGDVTNTPYKQVVIAAGEGAKAGLSAYAYLTGTEIIRLDWGKKK